MNLTYKNNGDGVFKSELFFRFYPEGCSTAIDHYNNFHDYEWIGDYQRAADDLKLCEEDW